jgi:hypothetical protein
MRILDKIAAYWRGPAPDEQPVAHAYVPVTVAVSKVAGGVLMVFDIGEADVSLVLPRSYVPRFADLLLDAIDAPEPDAAGDLQ